MPEARYDSEAAWYDDRVQGEQHPADCWVCTSLRVLDDRRPGLVVDLGCGTAAHHRALGSPERRVVGVDVAEGLLRIARRRIPAVVQADAARAPLRQGVADVVVCLFVHTDVQSALELFRQVRELLRPDGAALVVGVHPCFNNPFLGRDDDGRLIIHPGYLTAGFYTDGPGLGDGIRRRVGVQHLPLAEFLNSIQAAGLSVEEWRESGPDPPPVLGFRARRRP